MIPSWKIKREIVRLGIQIITFPQTVASWPSRLSEPRRRQEHDAAFPNNLTQTDGDIAPKARIAIFVLFQPNGIAESTFETFEALVTAGYAPLAISNTPLSPKDRMRLQAVCWRVMDRPNFGYDFGAYRDGIRLIQDAKITPEHVILMNDSFWCTMTPAFFRRVEAIDADLAGLLQDEKVEHDTKGGVPTNKRHIESYFLLISQHMWSAKEFKSFWAEYPMTDYKPHTIKNGEIGFSRKMAAAGFTLRALTDRTRFMQSMTNATAEALQHTLRYAAYDDKRFKSEADALLSRAADTDVWHAQALDHIRRWVNRRRFYAAFPTASHHAFSISSVKKSNEPIFAAARAAHIKAAEDGLINDISPTILAEIKKSIRSS